MAAHPAGTTYCIHAGTYNLGANSLKPDSGDKLIGDPVTSATPAEGGGGKRLTSVPTKLVGTNSFAVIDMTNRANVTLKNLDVSGATSDGAGIRRGDATTIAFCHVHDNSGLGVGSSGDGLLIEDSEIDKNGNVGFEGNSASGTKITNSATVRRSYLHDNIGNGIWVDCDGPQIVLESNTVAHNARKGIFIEISSGPFTIKNNVVKNNNLEAQITSGGIVVMSSTNASVFGNTLGGNQKAGIRAAEDSRVNNGHNGCQSGFHLSNIALHDNQLAGDAIAGCSLAGVTCTNNAP
jgi:parallel beta-helix repeat protein